MERSAAGAIAEASDAVLLLVLGSVSLPVTDARSTIDGTALALAVTMIVSVAEAPEARLPKSSVIVPFVKTAVAPELGEAETNVTPLGNISVRITPVAGDGPLLVTVTTNVRFWPASV